MPRIRKKRQRINTLPEITLTPLIDTALTLLVIFMVTAPMMHNSIKIDLPQGNQQEAKGKQEKKITVYIDQKAGISLGCTTHDNGKPKPVVNKADLIRALQQIIGNDNNTTVNVEADKKVSYGLVYDLVDDIKFLGGVSHVVLAAEKRS